MNHDLPENEETRLREIIMTADRDAPPPDRAFLDGLKERSSRRFVEAAAARNNRRSQIMARIRRIAPRAMAAGVLVAIGAAIVMFSGGDDLIAKTRKIIEQAKGMRMKVTGTVEQPVKTAVEGHIVIATDGRTRQELSVNGQKMVMIFDLGKGKVLTLMPAQKIAVIVQFKGMPEAMRNKMTKQGNHLAEIKKMLRKSGKELGAKTIDGVKTKGYRTANDSMTMEIWVDAETGKPVRMEMEMVEMGVAIVMTDIEILDKVDTALFSLEAPKGYTLQKQPAVSMRPAGVKELTELFRAWGEVTGRFPDVLNPALFVTVAKDHAERLVKTGGSPEEQLAEMKRVMQTVSTRLVGAMMLKQTNETFHYQGKGVKLGDKATPVLWYKPKGKKKYVVMYGDLHVERMAKKDLPPRREPDTAPAPK